MSYTQVDPNKSEVNTYKEQKNCFVWRMSILSLDSNLSYIVKMVQKWVEYYNKCISFCFCLLVKKKSINIFNYSIGSDFE